MAVRSFCGIYFFVHPLKIGEKEKFGEKIFGDIWEKEMCRVIARICISFGELSSLAICDSGMREKMTVLFPPTSNVIGFFGASELDQMEDLCHIFFS